MERKKEKQQKFHDALLDMLYPPPSPRPHQEEDDEQRINKSRDGLNLDSIPDELEVERCPSSSTENENEVECGSQKLTRAQRKRRRKKQLKEEASRRKNIKIIGPLLPISSHDGECKCRSAVENEPPDVRQNADEELDTGLDKPGEPATCANQNKLKQRRMAKKLAKERTTTSGVEKGHQGQDTLDHNET